MFDPELEDETDEDQVEVFELFQMRGWTPEVLLDKIYAARYAEWLKTSAERPPVKTVDERAE
jgi:hypothetical protein